MQKQMQVTKRDRYIKIWDLEFEKCDITSSQFILHNSSFLSSLLQQQLQILLLSYYL
jgi:hypothetical protein